MCGLDSWDLEYGSLVGSCDKGYEISGSIVKVGNVLTWLRAVNLKKRNCAAVSQNTQNVQRY
jgi:hypothetical protein